MSRFDPMSRKQLGRVMDELTAQIRDAENKQLVIWEKTLRLHVNEKPALMPKRVWEKMVNTVLTQSSAEKVLQGSQPIPEGSIETENKEK